MARPPKKSALKQCDIDAIGTSLKPLRLSALELTVSREQIMEKIRATHPADTNTGCGVDKPWARESRQTGKGSTARCGGRSYRAR